MTLGTLFLISGALGLGVFVGSLIERWRAPGELLADFLLLMGLAAAFAIIANRIGELADTGRLI